ELGQVRQHAEPEHRAVGLGADAEQRAAGEGEREQRRMPRRVAMEPPLAAVDRELAAGERETGRAAEVAERRAPDDRRALDRRRRADLDPCDVERRAGAFEAELIALRRRRQRDLSAAREA